MANKTAQELGFKYGVGQTLAHVAQVLDFGAPANPKHLIVGAVTGTPRGYGGHAFTVLACHLELCSGGIQRTYICRVSDPGMVTNPSHVFHEHELIPWADAIATVSARQEKKKSD